MSYSALECPSHLIKFNISCWMHSLSMYSLSQSIPHSPLVAALAVPRKARFCAKNCRTQPTVLNYGDKMQCCNSSGRPECTTQRTNKWCALWFLWWKGFTHQLLRHCFLAIIYFPTHSFHREFHFNALLCFTNSELCVKAEGNTRMHEISVLGKKIFVTTKEKRSLLLHWV